MIFYTHDCVCSSVVVNLLFLEGAHSTIEYLNENCLKIANTFMKLLNDIVYNE